MSKIIDGFKKVFDIDPLVSEIRKEYHSNNILLNVKDKTFITADAEKITAHLKIKDNQLFPNLILPFNPITFEGAFNFQKVHPGNLRITIDEHGKELHLDVIRPNFVTGQITSFGDLDRIIQFPKDNENPEEIIQWESLKEPIRHIYELEENIRQDFVAEKQKFFWANDINRGFIICGINQIEKTLLITTENIRGRICVTIPKTKKWNIDTIIRIWPELKFFNDVQGDNIIVSMNRLSQLIHSDRNGVLRITRYHTSNKIYTFQTHINCC